MSSITIANKGQMIAHTNYWDSEQAKEGFYYLSWNAGAARLLVPDAVKSSIREMKTGKYVIISRGPWKEHDDIDALELMFEDDSDSPFTLILAAGQTDRMLPETDQGGGFYLIVFTRGGEKLRLPAKYRKVAAIPSLEPWVAH